MTRRVVHALALLSLAACGRDTSPAADPAADAHEYDPIVLRVPRGGGAMRAAVYPALDSVVWRATGFPALDRVLAFDPEAGVLGVVTRAGLPAHLDLRLGTATTASRAQLRSLTSVTGSDIFGIDARGRVLRLNPVGAWTFTPPAPATGVHPQSTGAAFIAARGDAHTTIWRVHPPDDRILDSASYPPFDSLVGTQLGDRLYVVADTAVIAVAARTLQPVASMRMRERVLAGVPTPSGDRVYLAAEGARQLLVINRFAEGRSTAIPLPAEASDLRMDPLARYVLARAAGSDSAWVVAIGTARVVATVATRWSNDLPAVAPDGSIATLGQRDVVFVDPESGREVRTVTGGAADFWTFIFWNGFRPRPEGLDAPVTFPTPEPGDDTLAAAADTAARPPGTERPPAPAGQATYIVSFAAVLSAERAAVLADSIVVGGRRARVSASPTAGAVLYRVVLGPYATRAEAEAVGRASGRSYWVFEEAP